MRKHQKISWRGRGAQPPASNPPPFGRGSGGQFRGSYPIFTFHAQAPKNHLAGAGAQPPHRIPLPLGGGQGDSSGEAAPFLHFMRKHRKISCGNSMYFSRIKGLFPLAGAGAQPPASIPLPLGRGQGDSSGEAEPFLCFMRKHQKISCGNSMNFSRIKGLFPLAGRGAQPPASNPPPFGRGSGGQFRGQLRHFHVSCISTQKSPGGGGGRSPPHRIPLPLGGGQGVGQFRGSCPIFMFHAQALENHPLRT